MSTEVGSMAIRREREDVERAGEHEREGSASINRGDDAVHHASVPLLTGDNILAVAAKAALPARMLCVFATGPEAPIRQRIDLPGGRELLVMPAVLDRHAGVKVLTVVPSNAGTHRPVINGLYTLFDIGNGEPIAVLDSSALTAVRTAAVSAAASSRLSRADSHTLTILGAGHLAPHLAVAHAAVRPIRRVTIWARRPEQALDAVQRVRAMRPDLDIAVATSLEQAIRSADIVSAATRATAPMIRGDWLATGTHVDLVGGYRPEMREIDDAGIVRSEVFVDSRAAALSEAGDIIGPMANSAIGADHIRGELADIARGDVGRSSNDAITLFKSVGTAMADLVAAVAIWEAWRGETSNE